MILSFSLENWKSFRNPVTFSMVASKERQHGTRVPHVKKYQTRALPIAAIYGGNASGKTNFFKALSFVQNLVVRGSTPDSLIPVEPYRLDPEMAKRSSRFCFELLIDEMIYEFSFAVTRERIVEEKLILMNSREERVLYHRLNGEPNFAQSLKQKKFLEFAFQGTQENQLFLTNSVSQKIDQFRPVFDWFKNSLVLIAPDSRFAPFEQFLNEGHEKYLMMNTVLPQLDTGIVRLSGVEVPFENIPLPATLKARLQEDIQEGETLRWRNGRSNESFVVTRKEGELIAQKLMTFHTQKDGEEVAFDIHQESDGSQRVIGLLPAFLELSSGSSDKVYVIDEIDRSLHPLLTQTLIEWYLSNCSEESRAQLLLTTHDLMLMDQKIFRRDEMWLSERNTDGVSSLIAFSDYRDIRYDKDVRKSYLQGRLGGIPRIPMNEIAI